MSARSPRAARPNTLLPKYASARARASSHESTHARRPCAQIILSRGHDGAVDWWSLGVLLYEMLQGRAPFTHNERTKLFELIVAGQVTYAHGISDRARSLIESLLIVDPSQRLGNVRNGVSAIRQHPFFREIKWSDVSRRKLTPPIVPSPTMYKFEALPPVALASGTPEDVDKLFEEF